MADYTEGALQRMEEERKKAEAAAVEAKAAAESESPTLELPEVELPESVDAEQAGNLFTQAVEGLGNLVLRNDIDPTQYQQIVEQGQQNPINQGDGPEGAEKVAAELGKATLGAPVNLGAKLAGAAEFTGDFAGAVGDALGIIDREEEDIPWSENYRYAQYDLGLAQTETLYGGLIQEALSFAMAGGATGAIGTAAGFSAKGQAALALGSDFILDYFSDADGGNLSNLVQNNPLTGESLANPLSAALAHKDEDNPHWRRFKNSLEGLIPGVGVLAVQGFYRGVRAGNALDGTPAEKAELARKVAQEDPTGVFADSAKAENQGVSGRPAPQPQAIKSPEEIEQLKNEFTELQNQVDVLVDNGREDEAGPLMDQMAAINKQLPLNAQLELGNIYRDVDIGPKGKADITISGDIDPRIPVDDPEVLARLQEVFGEDLANLSTEEIADVITRDTLLGRQSNLAAQEMGKAPMVYDVMWDASGTVGTEGLLKIWKELNNVFEQLEPGSIVRNTPAEDMYGKGQSQAQRRTEAAKQDILDTKQFERFKEKMDGQYPLTIGEGADAFTFKNVEEHYRGITDRAREMVAGPSTKDLSNARSRLYQRAGFGPILDLNQYAVVRGSPQGRRWLEPVNDLSEIPEIRRRVRAEATQAKPSLYEPQERAVQVDKEPDINSSAASFWEDDLPGGGRSAVDEVDVAQIQTEQGLKDFISERIDSVDVDEISRRLSRQPPEYVTEVFRSLANFANSGSIVDLEDLRFTNTFGVKGVDAGGAVVLDTLLKSVSERVGVLSEAIMQLDEVGGSVKTQADQLLARVEIFTNIKKEATQFSSKNLENWKEVPNNLQAAIARDREQAAKLFGELRENLNSSDPVELREGKKKLRALAIGLSHAKGDPMLQMSFIEGLARVGWSRFSSVMINSLLSGPLTHFRNIVGNLTAIGERGLISRPIGRLMQKDFAGAARSFQALNAIHESIAESLLVAGRSWNNVGSITTPATKVKDYAAETMQQLDTLIKTASNDSERAAAMHAKRILALSNNPWFTWPGKALQAGDDFTKSLLARMELKVQAADEAAKLTANLDPRRSKIVRRRTYNQLKNQKIGPNGKILDHDLVAITEDAAFQRPLEGWVKRMGESIQGLPGGRTFFMPFFTTGANITRYGLQGTPAAKLMGQYQDAVKYGTPDEKAIMEGRMAAGTFLMSAVALGAANDRVTGYGPRPGPDRNLWLKTHKPHSISFYDDENGKPVWIEHRVIPGMSMIWSVVADTVNVVQKASEGDAQYALDALPFFIASALDSQPMFQGVMNLSNFLDFESWPKDAAPETMLDITNRALGGAQMRRTFENAIAQSMHDYENWREKFLAQVSGGLSTQFGITEPIAKTDIITGKPMLTKYQSNRWNLVNPFTTQTSDPHPIIETLSELGYSKIADMVPSRVGGVPVEPLEDALLRQAIYDNGNFAKAMSSILGNGDHIFWQELKNWQDAYANGQFPDGTPVPAKEDSRWWARLDKMTGTFIQKAKMELMNGSSDVSVNYRETRETRRAKLGTGGVQNFSEEDQARFQSLIDF